MEVDPRLIDFLMDPRSYPEKPEAVIHHETHISHVFVGTTRVYKIKKPVNFGFLDFTSLSKRHFYCTEEVILNSRLAGGLYLGVIPIYHNGETYSLRKARGSQVAEYAVKMKRIPEEKILHHLMEEGKLLYGALRATGERLARFHREATVHKGGPYGGVKSMKINSEENFEQIKPYVGVTIEPSFYGALAAYTHSFLREKEFLFRERKKEGFVREGHGDLHSQHVCLTRPPMIFDCIEFNKRFRISDVLEDIAFLFMDLEYRGRFDLCAQVSSAYFSGFPEAAQEELLQFYKVYRAVVRGKIEGFTADGLHDEAQKAAAIRRAKDYFGLAHHYLEDYRKPFNPLVIAGFSGTGKSAIAKGLIHNAVVINSDEVRKELAGLDSKKHVYLDWEEGLYAPSVTGRVYRELGERAILWTKRGKRVIVDATFLAADQRKAFYDQCCTAGLNPFFIWCFADPHVLKERIEKRMADGGDVSDADLAVLGRQLSNAEQPVELPSFRVLKLNTAETVRKITRALRTFLKPSR